MSAYVIDYIGALRKVHPQMGGQFVKEWKTYLYKWKKQVEYVVVEPILSINVLDEEDFKPESYEDFEARFKSDTRDDPEPEYESNFDPVKHHGGSAIKQLISLAETEEGTRRDEVELDDWSERYANTWKMGIQAFEYLEGTIGLDIDRVFDRWNQVPSIFVPKHVSDRHGLTEKGSLYELLNDAIRAFVAGAPAASVAMCRAAMEMVLRDHYLRGSSDDNSNLHDVIDLAVARYDFLSAKKLHSLRRDANRILHAYNSAAPLSEEDERKLLSFLKDLKFYIERAPDR